jgi:hypothetical protein
MKVPPVENTVLIATVLATTALFTSSVAAQPAAGGASPGAPAARPVPRTAGGKPDFNGYWQATPPRPPGEPTGRPLPVGRADPKDLVQPNTALRNGDFSNLTNDGVPARRQGDNLPLYKPEYWEKVLDLDLNGNKQDPFGQCLPMSMPRMGPPARIMQTTKDLFLVYRVPFQQNQFRTIPIGPRTQPVDRDGSWNGDPVAHWDGDTLVIETMGFNDLSWMGAEGYFHSYDLKVTERFRPQGDRILYDVTVEDPTVLQKPWVLNTRTLYRITDPAYRIEEADPCSDRDATQIVGKQREM